MDTLEKSPRPTNVLIGFAELSAVLGRPAGSLRTIAHTLPFRRWKVGGAVVFNADEVKRWHAERQAALAQAKALMGTGLIRNS